MADKLGNAIRSERYRKGLSQRQVALAVNTSTATVSNTETGHREVAPETMRAIAVAVGLDPRDFPELAELPDPGSAAPAPGTQQERRQRTPGQHSDPASQDARNQEPRPAQGKQDPKRDRRQAPSQGERTPRPAPGATSRPDPETPGPQRHAPAPRRPTQAQVDQETEDRMIRQTQQFLESGFFPGARELEPGVWQLPDNPVSLRQIAQDSSIQGEVTNKSHDPATTRIELRQGMVIMHIRKEPGGTLRLDLVPQNLQGPRPPAYYQFHHDQDGEAELYHFVPVLEDAGRNLQPGEYRLEVQGDATWTIDWQQYAQGTGWVRLTDFDETPPENPDHWTEPGFSISEPTAPTGAPVTLTMAQRETGDFSLEAYALDGSHTVSLYTGKVGPEPITIPTQLRPDAEYIVAIMAEHPWHMTLSEAGQTPEDQPKTSEAPQPSHSDPEGTEETPHQQELEATEEPPHQKEPDHRTISQEETGQSASPL